MKYILRTFLVIIILGIFAVSYFYLPSYIPYQYVNADEPSYQSFSNVLDEDPYEVLDIEITDTSKVTHLSPPEPMKAIYMTSWVAGTPHIRKKVIKVAESTEVNAIIIDIKDDTGRVSFEIAHPTLVALNSSDGRVKDMQELIGELHEKNIYVIGRIAVFQDPYLIKKWPDEAVHSVSDPENFWADRKGIGWFDAGSEKVWDYVSIIAEEATKIGFDEINFDYIRFPSDGNMRDLLYPYSEGLDKSIVMETFFAYLDNRLRPQGIVISADIFGMTTVNTDDLGIGQVLEKTLPYFDYVYPMVYPSHFPDGWYGISNPAAEPYKVIFRSMKKAAERAEAMGEDPLKLRPWLQDFNLGATYTPQLVRDQINATYDTGLTSWLIWDPRNTYTVEAFNSNSNSEI
jgi:hypothetical protein